MKKEFALKMALVFCIVLGIGFLLQGTRQAIKLQGIKKDYIKTEGEYIEKEFYGKSGRGAEATKPATYRLIYEYRVDGVTYTAKTNYGSRQIPPAGEVRTVYYNPDAPAEAVLDGTDASSVFIWSGILFILVPGMMLAGIFAVNGKSERFTFHVMDIAAGSTLIITGISTIYLFSGDFSLSGLLKTAGPFAFVPVSFIIAGVPTLCRGIFVKR